MSSACLLVKTPSFGSLMVNNGSDTNTRLAPLPESQTPLWRPWLSRCPGTRQSCPYPRPSVPGRLSSDGKAQSYQHPVRLFWPKSKSFDFLFSDGEALLRNFPVQATISFYEDSDSEGDEEEEELGKGEELSEGEELSKWEELS